ncbi:MAG: hypothetical protein OXC29_25110, partial [Rhodococcus sp.]|nr:hypothetical protein [Rhodococcus sp. (in: high G+C Gram-positive bacteria)]
MRATRSGDVTRRYIQRLRVNGKPTNRKIAHVDEIGLADARAQALENWLAVREGRTLTRARITSTAPTFETIASRHIASRVATWRPATLQSWNAVLNK